MASNTEVDTRKKRNADWMGKLPARLREVPLCTLAIPGSHDSGTFDLTCRKGIGPDESRLLRVVMDILTCLCCCVFVNFLKKWSKCQRLSFCEQLDVGVRFFDMRVARYKKKRSLKKSSSDIKVDVIPDLRSGKNASSSFLQRHGQPVGQDLYCIHAYYGGRIRQCIEEIRDFLMKHENEVVLLDFNHFYDMDNTSHEELARCIKDVFGSLLCLYSPDKSLKDLTLNKLCENGTRIIVFYHEGSASFPKECSAFWPGSTIDSQSSWANTMDLDSWKQKQDHEASKRHYGQTFYVCQGVLTPDTKVIAKTFCCAFCCCCCQEGIEKECAGKLNPVLPQWMSHDVQTAERCVIYMADWVDEDFDGEDFVQSVLALNK